MKPGHRGCTAKPQKARLSCLTPEMFDEDFEVGSLGAEKLVIKGAVQRGGHGHGVLVVTPPVELLDSSEVESSCGKDRREHGELLYARKSTAWPRNLSSPFRM